MNTILCTNEDLGSVQDFGQKGFIILKCVVILDDACSVQRVKIGSVQDFGQKGFNVLECAVILDAACSVQRVKSRGMAVWSSCIV